MIRNGEVADLIDFVAPELDPQRVFLGRREHVDQATAHRELAALLHHVNARIAGIDELAHGVVEIRGLLGLQCNRFQICQTDDEWLQNRADRCNHDADGMAVLGMDESTDHRQPLADDVSAGREPFMRKRFPRWELGNGGGVKQRLQGRNEILGFPIRGRDGEHRP